MTKYLFYAGFLYFSWYAGNKAFPSTQLAIPSPIAKSQATLDGMSDKHISTAGNTNVEIRAQVSGWLDEVYVQERTWVSQGQALFHISRTITPKHTLITAPVSGYLAQINFKEGSLIGKSEKRPLAVLSEKNK